MNSTEKESNGASNKHEDTDSPTAIYSDDQLTTIVEAVLGSMDLDKDGYINWAEYVYSNKHDTKEDDHHGSAGAGEHHEEPEKTEAHPQDDETLQSLIDPILELMDKDHDGFISYPEYRAAEAAESAQNAAEHH
ncbi:hypothetical protein quinque_012780 [Culex quinquefasciatus]